MKRLLALALCALFACQAGARTLYVDAKRPNNKGNGLSVKKAKKTIQAAINVAKKGDTILVYPGTYAPIKTNNKKIAIKSVKGKSKTTIAIPDSADEPTTIAMLGKPCVTRRYYGTNGDGPVYYVDGKSRTDSCGNSTCLTGFSLDGGGFGMNCFAGVTGGTLKSSRIRYVMSDGSCPTSVVRYGKLVGCTLSDNRYGGSSSCFAYCSTFSRCKIVHNTGTSDANHTSFFDNNQLYNCLVAENEILPTFLGHLDDSYALFFDLGCTVVNCTVASNHVAHSSADSVFCWQTSFVNCILRDNTDQRIWADSWDDLSPDTVSYGETFVHNCDLGHSNTYKNTDTTNKDPKFSSGYKLKKGSYCINSGKLTKKQKKLVGTTDLAGKKRIRGKAIDRGCYEY